MRLSIECQKIPSYGSMATLRPFHFWEKPGFKSWGKRVIKVYVQQGGQSGLFSKKSPNFFFHSGTLQYMSNEEYIPTFGSNRPKNGRVRAKNVLNQNRCIYQHQTLRGCYGAFQGSEKFFSLTNVDPPGGQKGSVKKKLGGPMGVLNRLRSHYCRALLILVQEIVICQQW